MNIDDILSYVRHRNEQTAGIFISLEIKDMNKVNGHIFHYSLGHFASKNLLTWDGLVKIF